MTEPHQIHKEYAEALERGGPASIPVGDTVLCDIDDTDLTEDHRSGGFMFGSYAVGPCCAERYEESIRGYGEEHMIRARCPEGVSFADWVRGMRGPGAAITITPGLPGDVAPVNGTEGETVIAGLLLLGAGTIVAARSVALAAIGAWREAVAAAREAVESGWVKGGLTITEPKARFLPLPPAVAQPEPEPSAEPVTETKPLREAGAA